MKPNWTPREIPSLTGKNALVTGANSGIGFHTALELARAGAQVILACRDSAKGAAAIERIRLQCPAAELSSIPLDLASLRSIHLAADAFNARQIPLDLLINNAGIMAVPTRHTTADGFELQFGTNHLGHFALTGLLLASLLRADAPRVITVSSIAHKQAKLEFDNLNAERRYRDLAAYSLSKLANLLFAFELQRRAAAAGLPLRSIAAHPGVATTNLFAAGSRLDRQPLFSWLTEKFVPLLGQSDACGAWPILYAATASEVSGGDFIGPRGPLEFRGYPTRARSSPIANDPRSAAKLWQLSEQLTHVQYAPLTPHFAAS
ncbi:MAG TPA: oxidoreductase [Phycisphaerae bacterium]|nr:oxidoreductase [Phycisphaerae bacterium]